MGIVEIDFLPLSPHPNLQDLGLPEQFTSLRPKQEEAFQFLQRATKRVRGVCGPCGFGKGLVYVLDALLSKKPTAFVTDSRPLQDQLATEFKGLGMVDLRGRANYKCQLHPEDDDYTCEQGYAARCPHKGTHGCGASSAEMRAAASWFVVTNYPKWIHARRFSQGLSHIQRVVFDEGDQAPHALGQAMQVILRQREIEETLGVNFPPMSEAEFFTVWKPWAYEASLRCTVLMAKARGKLLGPVGDVKSAWVKHYTHLRNLSRRLNILATANVENWVVEELERGYQFDPIAPAKYAESALLLKVPEIVVMSATLQPKTLWMMGVGQKDYEFKEFMSDFDPKRCPCYFVPIVVGGQLLRVDSKAESLKMLWITLDQIAARRRDRNGLVQTVSFARRDEVLAHSRFATSMVINERGEPTTDAIEQFRKTYPGGILVSPSVGRGFDFKYKLAEWQFLCKLPFPPPSKILKARTERDKEHPHYLTMQKFVQEVGRVMRDSKDQGETIISDANLVWFLKGYGHLAPKSFGQFFRRADVLPSPPERLA